MSKHELKGIEANNLLAFLALLGLMRALDAARPDWTSKVSWSGVPLHPVLHVPDGVTTTDVVAATAEGCKPWFNIYATFPAEITKLTPEIAQNFLAIATPEALALMSALCVDVKPDRVDWMVLAPYRHKVSGSVQLIERGQKIVKLLEVQEKLHDAISRCILMPWTRSDNKYGLLLDPNETQQYAYMANNPSEETFNERGANALALVGLGCLVIAPAMGSAQAVCYNRTGRAGRRGSYRWPIWRHPFSLSVVVNLLRHPELTSAEPNFDALELLGVSAVMQARRYVLGSGTNTHDHSSIARPVSQAQ